MEYLQGKPRHRRSGTRRRGRRAAIIAAIVVVLVVAAGVFQLLRPVGSLSVQPRLPADAVVPGGPPSLPWPAGGQAAVEVPGFGSLASPGGDQPVPMASLAKMMVGYVVLHDHPLVAGANGPAVPLTADDVNAYRSGQAQGESVVRVAAGEMLPERQALEGLLVASGNNLATAIARWDKGNPAGFIDEMNATASRLGLTHTHYADPSGVNPATVSTASEQLKLAIAAMADATFAQIVAEPQVNLPLAGTLANFNTLVGKEGVVGIKTGNSTAAGGCLVIAARRPVAGHDQLVYAAVLGVKGQNQIRAALTAGKSLVDAAAAAVRPVNVLTANQTLAHIHGSWGGSADAAVDQPVQLQGWGGLPLTYRLQPRQLGRRTAKGDEVGKVIVTLGSQHVESAVRATASIHSPSLPWRLKRL